MNEKTIIIIKFGGDVITDKTKPFSVNTAIISRLIQEIKTVYDNQDYKFIIVHGGGSYGHPVAKKYEIHKGIKDCSAQSQNGIIETHKAMLDLNSIILNQFASSNLPAFPLSPVSHFFLKNQKIRFTGLNQIDFLLELNIIPILYGDILFHFPSNCSILSGDRIISLLCGSHLKNYIKKVIFLITEDGFVQNFENSAQNQNITKIVSLNDPFFPDISFKSNKIDVTGGIQGKLLEIRKISSLGIPVILMNGTKENRLKNELNDENEVRTLFTPV